jgi:ketosteroid isomerase-like protein
VPESSDRGAGEREGGPTNSMAWLPRLGRQWKSVSPTTETLARKDDGEGAVRARRESVGGVGGFTEGGVGFFRAEARQSVFNSRR